MLSLEFVTQRVQQGMECPLCGPVGGLADPGYRGRSLLLSSHACVHELGATAMAWAAVMLRRPCENCILAPQAGDREDCGVREVAVAQRTAHRPSPSFDTISRDTFSWKVTRGVLDIPGTELFHEGPGPPLISSCGPALGWNQECSKE